MNRNADLSKILQVRKRKIDIYPDCYFVEGVNKPVFGEGLNQQVRVTFKNFFNNVKEAKNKADFIKKKCMQQMSILDEINIEENFISIITFGI